MPSVKSFTPVKGLPPLRPVYNTPQKKTDCLEQISRLFRITDPSILTEFAEQELQDPCPRKELEEEELSTHLGHLISQTRLAR